MTIILQTIMSQRFQISLHEAGTPLLHFLAHMSIDIQREGYCRMAQIFRYRLHIDALLQRQRGVCMPQIMKQYINIGKENVC